METQMHNQEPDWQKCQEDWAKSRSRGKIFGGIILVGVGSLLMARHLGADLPEWLFSWKILLIVIGLFIGFKHSFRTWGWLVPIAVGTAFLIGDQYPEMQMSRLFWPALIIIVGLAMIFRPRNRHHEYWRQRWHMKHRARWEEHNKYYQSEASSDDRLETTSVFAGVRKNVISKDFKGGEVNCFFGGAVINLAQADINGKVVLEVNAVFGGAKLIVPQHWVVQSADLVSVMGGIDDKRPVHNNVITNPDKILVLRGTAVFGGIEILN